IEVMLLLVPWFVVSMMICSFYSRTFLSIISGVVAGIWGFTGLTGFVFYFLIMLVASIGLLAKSKFSVHTYFDSWSRILVEGVLAGLMMSSYLVRLSKNLKLGL
uniref:ER membrane protein complex subunit 6 n=1 Tax=Aegilops tauschii subsp. strangulata TaxID=200361 RepID=A0A452ZU39_AEGTS